MINCTFAVSLITHNMCLILFGYRTSPTLALLVAANRDEFHERASAPADFWQDEPHILAGRDLVAGGTWLGCTRDGRFAALTNFSNPDDPKERSRGLLVQNFLNGSDTAEHYAHHLEGELYAGYNLLLFDGSELVYTSNRGTTDVLNPGFYGLSNAELGAEWPKCVRGAQGLRELSQTDYTTDDLLHLLNDRHVPPDEELPHRGRPVDMERRVAPCFLVGDEYGTRASTVLELGDHGVSFCEQSYAAGGVATGRVQYEFVTDS